MMFKGVWRTVGSVSKEKKEERINWTKMRNLKLLFNISEKENSWILDDKYWQRKSPFLCWKVIEMGRNGRLQMSESFAEKNAENDVGLLSMSLRPCERRFFPKIFIFASFGNRVLPKLPKLTKKWRSTCLVSTRKNSFRLEDRLESSAKSSECRALNVVYLKFESIVLDVCIRWEPALC